MNRIRHQLLTGVLAVIALGMVACEPQPQPPRTVFTVNSTGTEADADWTDGICATSTGECTLRAAFQQAYFRPRVDIVLPAGDYTLPVAQPVTRDVRINWDSPQLASIRGHIQVRSGGALWMDGVSTQRANQGHGGPPRVTVEGTFVALRSYLVGLVVEPGGRAAIQDSIVGVAEDEYAVMNRGSLVAARSTLIGVPDLFGSEATPPVLVNQGGDTALLATAIAVPDFQLDPAVIPGGDGTCSGEGIRSLGHVHVEVPCGIAPAPGDSSGRIGARMRAIPVSFDPIQVVYQLDFYGPELVDRIPVGAAGCNPPGTDFFGAARGGDGCDIGAVERQPPV